MGSFDPSCGAYNVELDDPEAATPAGGDAVEDERVSGDQASSSRSASAGGAAEWGTAARGGSSSLASYHPFDVRPDSSGTPMSVTQSQRGSDGAGSSTGGAITLREAWASSTSGDPPAGSSSELSLSLPQPAAQRYYFSVDSLFHGGIAATSCAKFFHACWQVRPRPLACCKEA